MNVSSPPVPPRDTLPAAVEAAQEAGSIMLRHLRRTKQVTAATRHDIKLELDVRCQQRIARRLRSALPAASIFGEEGIEGDLGSAWRWVIDPIDGTVNFSYGIPHACVSIALQRRSRPGRLPTEAAYADGYETCLGVVFDPFTGDLWTATADGPASLGGRVIRASARNRLGEAIVALGFAKTRRTLNRMLPMFQTLIHRVRKIRIMGSAALSMTYVASARFDAYMESGVRLWDIAAGGLIIQRAGGVFWRRAIDSRQTYEIVVSAAPLQRSLLRLNATCHP